MPKSFNSVHLTKLSNQFLFVYEKMEMRLDCTRVLDVYCVYFAKLFCHPAHPTKIFAQLGTVSQFWQPLSTDNSELCLLYACPILSSVPFFIFKMKFSFPDVIYSRFLLYLSALYFYFIFRPHYSAII